MLSFFSVLPLGVQAGGIVLGGTRIIYPLDSRQQPVSVRNTDDKTTFLVQSWVEGADGQKTKDFVVTPPLYTGGPGNENMLRLVRTGENYPVTGRASITSMRRPFLRWIKKRLKEKAPSFSPWSPASNCLLDLKGLSPGLRPRPPNCVFG